jgi:DUF4097 and DUF4098 domain-containing protein YvlB
MKQKIKYLFFILLLTFSLLSAEDFEQRISRRFELSAVEAIELSAINGEIVISTSTGTAIDIQAVKKSDHKGEIEKVDVIFATQAGTLSVSTKLMRNAKAKVDFTVVIPEKLARAAFKSVNGRISCKGNLGAVTLKTVNGKIDFSGQFTAGTFATVNGTVAIFQERLLSGDLSASTVNGAIEIELNRESAFEVEGSTVNGSLSNDFGLEVNRHFVGASFSGKVRGGGHKVSVETVNGRIQISKI